MTTQATLSTMIYPQECLEKTIVAYSSLCAVKISNTSSEECSIEITSLSTDGNEDQITREFLNYLLDLSLERHLGAL